MTASLKRPLALFALAALLAAASLPPARGWARVAFEQAFAAYQVIYLDSQLFRFICL
jgi:hypothetical protein